MFSSLLGSFWINSLIFCIRKGFPCRSNISWCLIVYSPSKLTLSIQAIFMLSSRTINWTCVQQYDKEGPRISFLHLQTYILYRFSFFSSGCVFVLENTKTPGNQTQHFPTSCPDDGLLFDKSKSKSVHINSVPGPLSHIYASR